MNLDPSNPVFQRCVRGIEIEYTGDLQKADSLYKQAWEISTTALEYLVAAHYLARTASDPATNLEYNLLALEYADKIRNTEDLASFYPSLYLNVAKSYESLRVYPKAKEYYRLAEQSIPDLTDDGYGNMLRKGIQAGMERITALMA